MVKIYKKIATKPFLMSLVFLIVCLSFFVAFLSTHFLLVSKLEQIDLLLGLGATEHRVRYFLFITSLLSTIATSIIPYLVISIIIKWLFNIFHKQKISFLSVVSFSLILSLASLINTLLNLSISYFLSPSKVISFTNLSFLFSESSYYYLLFKILDPILLLQFYLFYKFLFGIAKVTRKTALICSLVWISVCALITLIGTVFR